MYSIFHYQETVVVARIAVHTHTHTHSETTKRRKKKKRKPKGSPGEVGGWVELLLPYFCWGSGALKL
jgi:hypothetical protein